MEDVFKIGKKLKQLREDRRLTQLQVADELGLSPNTYSDYEREVSRVPSEVVVSAAEFYKIGLDYFYNLRGNVNITLNDNSTMGQGYVENNHSAEQPFKELVEKYIDTRLKLLLAEKLKNVEREAGS